MKARVENTINKLTSVEFTDCALFGYSFSLSPVHRAQVYKPYVKPDHSKIRNCIQDHPLPWKMACWWCKIVWAGWFTSSFLHMKETGFLIEWIRIEHPRRIRLWRRTSSPYWNKANYPRERSWDLIPKVDQPDRWYGYTEPQKETILQHRICMTTFGISFTSWAR